MLVRKTTVGTDKRYVSRHPAFHLSTLALALGSIFSAQAIAAQEDAAANAPLQLGEININAAAVENPTAPLAGKVALRNGSATKSNAAITETPQSVSVVTADEMRDRKSDTLADALSYTPGFTSQPSSFNRTSDRFRMRGFDVESATGGSLRDGMRLQYNSYDGVQEPYGLERVEVVRGAASVLYGQLSPGGFVNGVSKRPTETAQHELGMQYGNHDRKQLTADFSGPLGDSEVLSYRLTMLKRDSDTQQDYINDDKLYIAPALTWRPNEDTSLTLLSFYQKSDTRFSAPLPYQLVKGVGNGPVTIGRHDFIGEPDYDDMNGEMSAIGYEFEHRFDEHTRISNKLRYYEADVKWKYLQAQTSAAAINGAANTGVLRRQYSDRRERSRALASDTNIETRWNIGGIENTFLVGADTYDASYDSHNFRANTSSINIGDYNYGQPVVVNKDRSRDRGSQIDTFQTGIYLQDQIKFDDHWLLLLGGRHDWADQDQEGFATGQKLSQDDESTTWRAGLVYEADNGLAPYISYSESFFPVAVADAPGQTFEPTEGKQYEIGIRYQPPGSNTLLSAAVYELTQENVVKRDLAGNNPQQIGEQRSRGLELEAKSDVTPQLTVIATYAYTDSRITKSVIQSEVGQRSEDTPYHQAALWADYNFALFGVPQLKVGGGARYKGTTQASGIDSQLPAYTLFDAMASYQIDKNWDVSLNANNVTNKKYVYCEAAICRYGDERELVTSVNFRW
ncbi:TonB-dependent siderophore receptor [Pseudomonas frederiksbergensis]|jgi:iron complex outermembrane receptor protein|uniref:TonB-dependent siderophore receptor n=1 Tax=Pseudomonas frederiksbergensis TaxID=104087 RepID=UPI000625F825|nr:TonB-dependent siderophore receptor [Pseudomonas frederiksbergensis]KHK65666.2 TonB-dependent receptor [Pseudomonas frederiksbergensis]WRV66103.1 TonB-dependent siderophore receptor [Pseudomonas frederiksbergensis]